MIKKNKIDYKERIKQIKKEKIDKKVEKIDNRRIRKKKQRRTLEQRAQIKAEIIKIYVFFLNLKSLFIY